MICGINELIFLDPVHTSVNIARKVSSKRPSCVRICSITPARTASFANFATRHSIARPAWRPIFARITKRSSNSNALNARKRFQTKTNSPSTWPLTKLARKVSPRSPYPPFNSLMQLLLQNTIVMNATRNSHRSNHSKSINALI